VKFVIFITMRITRSRLRQIIAEELLLEERTHTVQPGESLSAIAAQYEDSITALTIASANGNPRIINPGDRLIIPEPPQRLNANTVPSDQLKEWMRYEEGKMDSMGEGLGTHHESPYDDGAGNWTIGYGHKFESYPGDITWTREQANQQLHRDLMEKSQALRDSTVENMPEPLHIPISLTQNQFDALSSLMFHAGSRGYATSTLHPFIKRADITSPEFQNAFLNFRTVDGFGGIQRRRQRELEIFKGANPYPKK